MTLIAILVKNVGSQNIQIWPSLRQVGSGAALMDFQIRKPLQCLQIFTNVYKFLSLYILKQTLSPMKYKYQMTYLQILKPLHSKTNFTVTYGI